MPAAAMDARAVGGENQVIARGADVERASFEFPARAAIERQFSAQQRVRVGIQGFGERGEQRGVGQSAAALLFGNGFIARADLFGEHFLGKSAALAQRADEVSGLDWIRAKDLLLIEL